MHDAQLSATVNINTVSAAENINAAEKKKVLGSVGLLKEVGKGELCTAENINAARDYGSLQYMWGENRSAIGYIGECIVENLICNDICNAIDEN